ncbi:MAG: hypothetical protein H0V49_03370 [Nocardioidaceae bacterium]|nr:hypothetical protein [Nocardioidaceae bacterium]
MSALTSRRPRTAGAAVGVPTSRRQLWNHPVAQFVAAGLVALTVLILGSGILSKRAATDEAIRDAKSTTWLLANAVVQPALSPELVDGQAAALDRFDGLARSGLLLRDVRRVKLWHESGRIIYSDRLDLIGEEFAIGDDEREILANGGVEAEVSDLSRPENRFEAGFGEALEVYTRVRVPGGEYLILEVYFSNDDVARRSNEVLNAFRPITVAVLLIFMLVTGSGLWVLARRLEAAAADRERLLRAAVDASSKERLRIARDLHDGVVQDLAGTSFALSAAARDVSDRPDVAARLNDLGSGVRQSLRVLRSLLVDIYPPDLAAAGLAAALDDLVAPAQAAGVDVRLHVDSTTGLSPDSIALMWRVAQESVRNSLQHAAPTTLRVLVTTSPDSALLEVTDDGIGFDPAQVAPADHLGLRGMRDLAAEAGATLDVASTVGGGTTIRLEVER